MKHWETGSKTGFMKRKRSGKTTERHYQDDQNCHTRIIEKFTNDFEESWKNDKKTDL